MKTISLSLLGLALAAAAGFGADTDFNGKWLIRTEGQQRRAFELEVEGVGTPSAGGYFVTAFGGDRNRITNLKIENGELSFSFPRNRRGGGKETVVYRARMAADKLQGSIAVEGAEQPPLKWIAWRAPVLAETDDGSWVEGQPVELFNGQDLAGWRSADGWEVVNGILKNKPPTRDIISEKTFWNFRLIAEIKFGPRGNSGLGLRGRYEVQVTDDHGKPPHYKGNASVYSRLAPAVNASKPAGEWQTYDIRLIGREVTIVLNGTKVMDRQKIEGLTAMAMNPDEDQPGPIVLQGDHEAVEVRKLVVIPLVKGR